ncbi:MAG: septum formation initiator family protein [Tissierellia bacterium]|nr:septum formation initiator family protein [Tissierellia bacterium]
MARQKQRNATQRANRRFFTFILTVVLLISIYFLITFFEQSSMMTDINQEISNKQAQIESLNTQIQSLEGELERVNDVDYIEEIARKKLKMVMPRDIIYIDENAPVEE